MSDTRPSSSTSDMSNATDLTAYVNTIFRQMEEKFTVASEQMLNRMNDLGKKIDSLETNLGDIISNMPVDDSTKTSTMADEKDAKA